VITCEAGHCSPSQTYDRLVAVEKGNVLVRRATVDDAEAVTMLHGVLHRMHTEAHPDIFTVFDPVLTRPRFERLLADDEALIWIAEREGEAVGFVSATLKHQEASDTVREDRALHVHELVVAPQARRAGVGGALMQAVEDYARSLRLTSVSLNTWLFNTEASDFYERLGYQRLNMQMRRRL
jgi:ribosomal protein S18 acetylase RimI-like enzyme